MISNETWKTKLDSIYIGHNYDTIENIIRRYGSKQ